jgi:predicted dehydrogenase/threonine dehydrogenase-like Zn-dependent dehydrogenase
MLIEFGKADWISKARRQPEKVRGVLEKLRSDGLVATVAAVRSKLAQPIPLGYSNVGVVAEKGQDVQGLDVGDRVVSNGPHADRVIVSRNLCARIPDNVSDDEAAFTVVASIGLQGIRLAGPSLGEYFVVIGAGLIGLLSVQLLRAHGCRVLAIDPDPSKLKLASTFGAEICDASAERGPVEAGVEFSHGRGVDGVLITASTKSSDPVAQAARMCRKRGRIILVGVTGLDLERSDFFEKEITFQVSCSYGPGRYDANYEDKGQDYPIGYVRWTEQRNFEAVLDMLSQGLLKVQPLVSCRYSFEEAVSAYERLIEDRSVLGCLLEYQPFAGREVSRTVELPDTGKPDSGRSVVAFVGAGNYATRVLIPAFKAARAHLETLVTAGGASGTLYGKKAGFRESSTDLDAVMQSRRVNTLVIATRHDTHAQFVVRALKAGKNVFVEKPLALTEEELQAVEQAYDDSRLSGRAPRLMVGFNRRFSPQGIKMRSLLVGIGGPKALVITVNAGSIPKGHWTQDIHQGGGRIVGEACHFIDFARFLVGESIVEARAVRMKDSGGDTVSIQLLFSDGSIGNVNYFSNGSRAYPKERIEAFCSGRVLQLDNFRRLRGWGWQRFSGTKLWRQDKGVRAAVQLFLDAVEHGGGDPIAVEEIFEVSRFSIQIAEALR